MLNEEKIRIMADLAMFEKKNGALMKQAGGYFKSDYISRHLIRSFISYTICSFLIAGLFLIYNMDSFLDTISFDRMADLAMKGGVLYLAGLILYLILVYAVYAKRYDYLTRMNRIYMAKLKHLDKRYEYQSRSRELAREGRRV